MILLRNQRGQATIEIAVAAPIVALFFLGMTYLLYLGFAKIWLTRSSREGAVCLVTQASSQNCRSRLNSTLRSALPYGNFEIAEFFVGPHEAQVKIFFNASTEFLREMPGTNRAFAKPISAEATMPRKL